MRSSKKICGDIEWKELDLKSGDFYSCYAFELNVSGLVSHLSTLRPGLLSVKWKYYTVDLYHLQGCCEESAL